MGATLYTFNGGGTSGNWTDQSIWTTDPTGSTSINARVPASGDAVVITNSFVVFVNSSIPATIDLTIQRGGVLDLQSAAATFAGITSLSGQGTLRIGAPYFPSVGTNNFDDANTGTVEYYNWPAGASALPVAVTQYNNLRFLNTGTTAFTAQLDNNLTLAGSLTLARTNATAFPAGSTFPAPGTTPEAKAAAGAANAAAGAGTLFTIGKTASSNRTLTIQGDVNIGVGTFLGVTAVAGAHSMSVSGNFINNGTVNLHNGTANDNQVALLVFTGTTDANFANNGDTDLDILQVNKGIDSQVLLNVTSTGGVHNTALGNLRLNHVAAPVNTGVDILVLTNGITKLGSNIVLPKIHNGDNEFGLGSTTRSPTLWINGAQVSNDVAQLIAVYGAFRISLGSFSGKRDAGMVLREDGQLLIEGGTVTVNKFRPSRTSPYHRGSFTMTGGLLDCIGTSATSVNDGYARFSVPYTTQSFRMSGGIIRVKNPTGTDGLFHIGVNPNNVTVTGGKIELYLPDTNVNGKILSTSPLWDLAIIKPAFVNGTSKAILSDVAVDAAYTAFATTTAQPLTVLNDLTLDATKPTTFDAAGKDLTIQGSFNIGTGCTYLTGTNTTTFGGSQDQVLTNDGTIGTTANVGTFSNWTVNKANGTLTLAGSVSTYFTLAGTTLAIVSGVLNDAGKAINVQGNLINSAFHQSVGNGHIAMNGAALQTIGGDNTGVFGNLRINNTGLAAGAVAVSLTSNITVTNNLTLQSQHIFAIGAYRLALTNVNTNVINGGNLSGFNNLRMIQTAGNASDLGLQKTYGGNQSFTFPVGTSTKYTPAIINLTLATALSKYGQVSVSPANIRSPFATGSGNALKYFWKVRSAGFGTIPAKAINMTFTMLNADAVGTQANYVGGRYLPTSWTKYNGADGSGSGVISSPPTSDIAINSLGQFDGEFTAGETATAFGAVTAFYSIANGNWNANTTWSTTSNTGAAVPAGTTAGTNFPGPGNPVFVGIATGNNGTSSYHTVTVTANTAQSGSLVIDRGSVLDVVSTTGHNFGSLPDSKIGGSGRLRISSSAATATFPGGDFGSFIQYGGGTVEYYTTGTRDFTLPTTANSGTLTLNQYRNLWVNATSGNTITLPSQDLRVHNDLRTGTSGGTGEVFMSGASATVGNIRVDSLLNVQTGTFHLPATNTRTLRLDTDARVDATGTFDVVNNAARTHSVTIGGSLTNNGTVDFNVGTGKAALSFSGSANAKITGPTGVTTDLTSLTINKGTSRASTLTLDVAGTLTTPTNGWLNLVNGTLNYAKGTGTLTIHDANSTYLITDNAGLTVNAAGANVTIATFAGSGADLKLAGEIRVLQGALSVGTTSTAAGNDLEYASAGAPTLRVATGGSLYVNGQIRRTVNNLDGSLRYDQNGGTVDIDGIGASAALSNERGLFEVQGKGSIFRMTAGSLNLHRSNQKSPITTADLYLAPDSTVVTGGTVRLGNTVAAPGNVRISVNSVVPLYDLIVESGVTGTGGNTNTAVLAGTNALNLKGSLTIGNANSFFNANGLPLNIDQDLNNNNSSNSTALNVGGFQPNTATQTTTFTGKSDPLQKLSSVAGNLTVFGNLVLNPAKPSGVLQLNGNALTAGTLTLTNGTLDDNGNTMTALGDVLNSATHTSSAAGSITLGGAANQNVGGNGRGQFGNLTLSNTAGATTTANQEITKVLALNNGVLSIGSNLLWLSNTAATAVSTTATFDNTHAIRTNGIVADLGVRKSYPAGAANFTFPIGSAVVTKYTPVQMNLVSSSTAGTITVQPIDIPHPSTTDPANKELSYYWKVSSKDFTSPVVNQVFAYALTDVNGTESNYKLGRFLNGKWTPQGGILTSTVSTGAHTLTNNNETAIDGDYTGGEVSEFGAVPTFYSRNATAGTSSGANWTDVAAWTLDASGAGPSAGTVPTLANPVVILPGHLINAASNGRGAASLTLNGTLDLGTNLANNFSTVGGTGILRIGSAIFPAGNYANFVAANTGTVEFTGNVQLPARDTYNNLTLSGGTAKQLTNLDLNINGDLSIASGTAVENPTSQSITLTSATKGVTISGPFALNDGKLTTGAFLTTTTTGSLTLGAGQVSIGSYLTNNGTLTPGTAPLSVGTTFTNTGTYNASNPNIIAGEFVVGGDFSNTGTYTAGLGNLNVTGSIANKGSFTAGMGEVNAGMNFSNSGTYSATTKNVVHVNGDFSNLATGGFDAANSNMVLRGSFANANGLNFVAINGSLVQFITDANRFINGNTTFFDLQKLGSSSLILGPSTDVHVKGLMTIQNSVIFTGSNGNLNTLYLDNTATQPIVGNTLSSYVAGRLAMALPDDANAIRVFPVGAGQRYRPVTIKPLSASSSPVVLVEIINGAAPGANNVGNVDATLQNIATTRYYRIQLLSGVLNDPTVQLSFNTDVEDEKVNVPGNLRVARSNGNAGQWSSTNGSGVYSPDAPRGYTTSAATTIDNASFFVLASTNKVDNPLSGQAPLPVELISFSATRQGSAVQVAWATASEKNSSHFVVERSDNGRVFNDLARVEALGNSTARHNYGSLDTAPLAGISYYRLRQIDRDGTTAYSGVATVRFDGQAGVPTLVAYPNPANGNGFQLAAANLAPASGTVRVFDNVGRLVFIQTMVAGTAEATVQPAQPLASGMYFATWTTVNGTKLTTKVSVE